MCTPPVPDRIKWTESNLQDALHDLLSELTDLAEDDDFPEDLPRAFRDLREVDTFADRDIPVCVTLSKGLVLDMADGTEFQITIRQSAGPHHDEDDDQ